jgi:hypothetical protein
VDITEVEAEVEVVIQTKKNGIQKEAMAAEAVADGTEAEAEVVIPTKKKETKKEAMQVEVAVDITEVEAVAMVEEVIEVDMTLINRTKKLMEAEAGIVAAVAVAMEEVATVVATK